MDLATPSGRVPRPGCSARGAGPSRQHGAASQPLARPGCDPPATYAPPPSGSIGFLLAKAPTPPREEVNHATSRGAAAAVGSGLSLLLRPSGRRPGDLGAEASPATRIALSRQIEPAGFRPGRSIRC